MIHCHGNKGEDRTLKKKFGASIPFDGREKKGSDAGEELLSDRVH